MNRVSIRWLVTIAGLLIATQVAAADASRRHLVTADWLKQNISRDDVVLLDASFPQMYSKKHIPGAVNVDVFGFGVRDLPVAEMERRIQSWGISPGKQIVIYDEGGSFMATRLFFDLYYNGFPADGLFVLDGGLSKWQELGGPVTADATPPPKAGSFRITKMNEDVRVRLPEFLTASGDPKNHALVEALEPGYHFGDTKFFDRAGHVPNAIMLPSPDFFNADKTFKSGAEIEKMVAYLGVKPDQQIHSYCGGGVAATVPFFAMKFMLGYPKVKLYKESQLEWLRDDRGLPLWTYDAPLLKRDATWLQGWSNRMTRMYGVAQVNIVDVRPADAFNLGHVPFAVNIPASVFKSHLSSPDKMAEVLARAGVNPAYETVIISEGGLNESSALAFVMLEKLGQKKISVLMDTMDDWGLRGFPLTKEPTIVGARESPNDFAVPATAYPVNLRGDVVLTSTDASKGIFPKVLIDSGKTMSGKAQQGKVIHVPYTELLNSDGTPKAAGDLWKVLVKAGVPRYAEIISFADDPGQAAINYYILRLMGYPDVKVLTLPSS